jgi:atypical dual specificity phosphatase
MINISKPVLVHCFAAGRSGTVLASYLIHKGMNHSDALGKVRQKLPDAVETDSQMNVLKEYHNLIRNQMNEGILSD